MEEMPSPLAPTWDEEERLIQASLPNPAVMGKIHALFQNIMFGNTYFEGGEDGRQEICDHRDAGGSFQIHMSHLRRWAPILMAYVTKEEPLKHLELRTGITARQEVFEIPVVGKGIVAQSGAQRVKKRDKVQEETPEERNLRREENEKTQAIGGRWLAHGYHWLVYTEGNSRVYIEDDEGTSRIPRQPGVALPVFSGFLKSLDNMTPSERQKTKILGIGEHYPFKHTPFGATLYVARPESPIEGPEGVRLQQGQDLMDKIIAGAARSAWLRNHDVSRETIENFSGLSR